MKQSIPQEVLGIGDVLIKANFSAYLVGGCVRDMLLERAPRDWDIATNATPAQIQALFPDSVYENVFGTVGVKTRSGDPATEVVEVTTFRSDGAYTDHRHPDAVMFADTIEQDLARRDFTVNAMALNMAAPADAAFIDPFRGHADLKKKLVRAVRDPHERFREDALRLMRAIRMAVQLDCAIEHETAEALMACAELLKRIAPERIRDEFTNILMTERASQGMVLLERYGLLPFVFPELLSGVGVAQNRHHIYTVWEHSIRTLEYAAGKNGSLAVRLAALLHDVGKPPTKRGQGEYATFYGHDAAGSRIARTGLERLRFARETIDRVCHLIRYHMFYYNVGEVTEAGVRRFISRVGIEHLDELIQLREADRIGSGVPKAQPYRLRHLLFMIEKVRKDPISPKMLALNGTDLMKELNIAPGPRVGWIQKLLLQAVLRDPSVNTPAALRAQARALHQKAEHELQELAQEATETKEEFEEQQEQSIRKKFFV